MSAGPNQSGDTVVEAPLHEDICPPQDLYTVFMVSLFVSAKSSHSTRLSGGPARHQQSSSVIKRSRPQAPAMTRMPYAELNKLDTTATFCYDAQTARRALSCCLGLGLGKGLGPHGAPGNFLGWWKGSMS